MDEDWNILAETTPPVVGIPCLVYTPRTRRQNHYSVQIWSGEDGFTNDLGISHWMLLPGPPPAPYAAVHEVAEDLPYEVPEEPNE